MKFKKDAIEPDMVIHCPKEEDARMLLEHLGYACAVHPWERFKEESCYKIIDSGMDGGHLQLYLREREYFREEKITEFSDLIEPDEESESANFIKSGEIIAKGISKAIKDAESSTENSTDTSTGMTNQRAIEILADKIRCNEPECGENCVECSGATQEEENKALRVAIAALIEKESQKDSEKVDKLIDEYEQTKKTNNFHDDTSVLVTAEQEFYLSDSDTELIGGEWSLNTGKAEGKYLWSRDKYTYSDGIARYGNMSCRGYSMEVVPDADPDEMTAVEVLEWLNAAKRHPDTMEEAFGTFGVGAFGSIFDCNTPRKILEQITAYEASKKVSKPIEYEWGDVITLYDLGDKVESRFVPLSEDYKDEMKALLKEYVENYGRPVSALYVTHGAGLRVKEDK